MQGTALKKVKQESWSWPAHHLQPLEAKEAVRYFIGTEYLEEAAQEFARYLKVIMVFKEANMHTLIMEAAVILVYALFTGENTGPTIIFLQTVETRKVPQFTRNVGRIRIQNRASECVCVASVFVATRAYLNWKQNQSQRLVVVIVVRKIAGGFSIAALSYYFYNK